MARFVTKALGGLVVGGAVSIAVVGVAGAAPADKFLTFGKVKTECTVVIGTSAGFNGQFNPSIVNGALNGPDSPCGSLVQVFAGQVADT